MSIFFKYFKININYIFGSVVIITMLLLSNVTHFKKIKMNNSTSYCYTSDPRADVGYYKYWTNKFPETVILKFCNDIKL